MKIFHVINSLGTGGSESVLYTLIKKDKKNTHYIFVISERGERIQSFQKIKNCRIINLTNFIFIKRIFLFLKFLKLEKKRQKQVCINSWMYKAHIFCFIAKFKINFQLLIHVRHCGITNKHTIINKLPIYINLYLSKLFADKIIYNSYFSRKNHQKIGFEKTKGQVIQNGFEKTNNGKKTFNRKFKNKIVIGMLARQNFIKDHITLIKAFIEVFGERKNLVLFLQGAGLKNDRNIKNLIKNKNIYISPSLDKEYFYSQIDLHVLSSFGESFPNVVAESMQRKIITISSDVGDVRYMLPKDFIFKCADEKELKKKLITIVNKIEKKDKMLILLKQQFQKKINEDFKFNIQLNRFKSLWKIHSNLKKILFIIPSLEGGGAERVMTFLANDLKKKNYNVTILVLGSNQESDYKVDKNIKVIFLNKSRSIFATYQIVKYFFKNFDIAISTIVQCNILCIFAKFFSFSRTKLYVRETNTPSEILKYNFNLKNYFIFIIRKLYIYANLVLCNSKGVKADLKNKLKIKSRLLFFLPNSLNTDSIDLRSNESIKKINKPYFLFAGRYSKQKNIEQLLYAFNYFYKKNKKFNLYIFGKGPEKTKLKGIIKNLNLHRAIFLKPFQKNIFKYIKNSNGVLLSSKWEGMPNILLQALYLNKPVLSTNCKSGPKELKKFGYDIKLSPVNDINSYAIQMEKLSKSKINISKNLLLNKRYSNIYWKKINNLF